MNAVQDRKLSFVIKSKAIRNRQDGTSAEAESAGMTMKKFVRDDRGSAVRWFALTAVVLSAFSVAGAHGLAWLSQSGRVSVVAYRAPSDGGPRGLADAGVDAMPTGSVPSQSVMVRIR